MEPANIKKSPSSHLVTIKSMSQELARTMGRGADSTLAATHSIAKTIDHFIVYRIFADDSPRETLQAINFRRLAFRDPSLETKFRAYYSVLAVKPNRNFMFASFVVCCVYQAFAILRAKTFDTVFWTANGFRIGGLALILLAMLFHRVPGYKAHWEPYRIWLIWISAVFAHTLYLYVTDLLRTGDLAAVPVSERGASEPSGIHYLCLHAPLAWTTTTFGHVWRSAVCYVLVHASIVLVSQHDRLNLFAWMIVGLYGGVLTGCLIAFRKEAYHRRIYWLRQQLQIKDSQLHFSDKKLRQGKPLLEQWAIWFKTSLLLLDPDTERASQFNRFVTQQSTGQTRTSLSIAAVSIAVSWVQDYTRGMQAPLDLALRGILIPVMLASFALSKPMLSNLQHGPWLINTLASSIMILIVVCAFLLGTLGLGNENFSPTSHYVFMIPQATLAISTSAGYRYINALVITVVYIVVAIGLQAKFEYKDDGFVFGSPAVFLAACIFLHGYEKLLFADFSLSQRYQQKLSAVEKSADVQVEAVVQDDVNVL